jgi:hypothetical protein
MVRVWILQANPELFDIDAALRELPRLEWRTPQHTSEVRAGDIAVIWRAGSNAGVVGIGRFVTPPRETQPLADEQRFDHAAVPLGRSTYALVEVRGVELVSKEQVEALPSFLGHLILVAPRSTVYQVDEQQWQELSPLLSAQPPPFLAPVPTEDSWPRPFAWDQRKKAVYPLPGGYDGYLSTLRRILSWVVEARPDRQDLGTWIHENLSVSVRNAEFIVDFLARTSLLEERAGVVMVTDEGSYWLSTDDPRYLIALLHARVRFIGELLLILDQPRTIESVRREANTGFKMGWTTRAQIDRRRGWLQSAGAIMEDEEGRLVATAIGREMARVLDSQSPFGETALPAAPESAHDQPGELAAMSPEPSSGIAELLGRFRAAASNTADPAEFERLTADVFDHLGFTSQHLGGAGRTDVLLNAPLGRGEGYRVVVDCKTTSHEAVSDAQIDWITLREHRESNEADHVAVVGPAFRAARVAERAHNEGVALLDVSTLEELCVQHEQIPLGLHTYRLLFESEPGGGMEAIALAAEEQQRWSTLAATTVILVGRLQEQEGGVVARDVYWNLDRESELLSGFSVDEIEQLMHVLAHPSVGLLRSTAGGFKMEYPMATVASRLRGLSRMLQADASS